MSTAPVTIAEIFVSACAGKGDAELFGDPSRRVSGTEAERESRTVAAALESFGLAPGDRVAFLAGSSVAHAITFFGCLRSGIVPCLFHVRDTADRLARTLAFIDAKALVADPANLALAQTIAGNRPIVELGDGRLFADNVGELNHDAAPADEALVLMSSGTTGDPKCVIHTQSTLAATAEKGRYIYGVSSSEDSTIVIMAPSFAAWIHTVLPFVAMQGRIYFDSEFGPDRFLQTLQDEQITVAPLVPTVWRMVLAASPEIYDLSRLKTAFYSGEPGSASLVADLADKICPNVVTTYLASEGGNGAGIVAGPEILQHRPAAVGKPVPGADMRIIDPDGGVDDTLKPGEIGEVVVRGPSVSVGYLKDPDLTAAKFVNGWWRSGDLGTVDGDGVLSIAGRLDNRINTGGIKVSAEEVEAALLQHPSIRMAAVIGVPDPQWGERIEAHVVVDGQPPAAQLLADIRAAGALPGHLLPKVIHVVDQLPTGPTGKLYRRALKSTAE